jgi:hypothetical protein
MTFYKKDRNLLLNFCKKKSLYNLFIKEPFIFLFFIGLIFNPSFSPSNIG